MSNNKNHKKRSADFASLLSQHTKVKRQRKQPRKKSKSTEPVNAILATLRRVCATGELLTPTPLPGSESSSSSSSSSEATLVAPTTAPKNVCARDQQTLALCFLCVEALPHRKVWQEWVRQAKETFGKGGHGLRIFIHAKFPERLDPWSQQYLIRDDRGEIINFKPDWGKIEVTRALMKLFETALTFPDVGRMTYVSESCIPIVTFDQACTELWHSDRSWVAAYDKPVNGYDTLMMNAVNTKYIPKECVRKCDTWIMLTRQHAHAVLVEVPALVGSAVWPHFSRVKVADEIFMPTMMTVIGAIKGGGVPGGSGKRMGSAGDPAVVDQRTDQVERRKTTHVDWSKGGPHPKAFTEFTLQVQQDGMSHGCIFARKFGAGTCPVNVWRTVCGVAAPAVDDQDTASALTTAATPATTATTVIPFTGERDVLVIVCAGDTSLHDYERWYALDRTYDLCVVYYGNDAKVAERYQRDSDHYHAQQGPKWQLIRAILKKGLHTKYKYIWMPDDDLAMGSVAMINEFFNISKQYQLNLSQPSLHDINVEHQILIHRPNTLLRYTNFVEIMAPLLSIGALLHLMPTLDNDEVKSAWGLDFVWPYLLNNTKVAVVDKTPMTHTRPVTAFNPDSNFYRKYNIDPMLEGHQNMTKYGVPSNTKPKCFSEIRLDDGGGGGGAKGRM